MKGQSKKARVTNPIAGGMDKARSQRGEGGQDKTEGHIRKGYSWAGWAKVFGLDKRQG
ncbi:uncharacterized protein LACBIDRAFT_313330 [Laccaria bicolor S238N-H82]|uniref:Predicted protein n=1 Tax=Laccaria bicolor (strain S238N-H82 / ATCC MYA-4686) TaxID=486041 RepID=B0DY28_LACBS|nr:uncharacterized protein LACBIDRAFT_313330 [Laccaria bicolor S238N-H82]EDR00447.1 predicted protein [Laccaria bicolor S238N-H82]|eukprot:XP_001888839.1 predicted protein [Laccaria bicolor S238N-H82]